VKKSLFLAILLLFASPALGGPNGQVTSFATDPGNVSRIR
jgi:hypothetical protein